MPCAQPLGPAREPVELGDRGRRRADVADGEERFAAVEDEVGSRRVVRREKVERPAEERRGARELVAIERPASGRGEAARRRARRARGPPRRAARAREGVDAPARGASRSSRRPRRRARRANRRGDDAGPRVCPSACADMRHRG
jgi:hypothetical protein